MIQNLRPSVWLQIRTRLEVFCMQKIYDQFIREKRFLENLSERTLKYYREVSHIWDKHIGGMPDKQNIKEFVIKIQESGINVYTANSYIRGINAFLLLGGI